MSGFGDRDRYSDPDPKKLRLTNDDNDAAGRLILLRGDSNSGFKQLLAAIEASENNTPPPPGELSRNSSVTSFFSATSPSPTLSRDSSYSSSQSDPPIPYDVQKRISQLKKEDIDEIKIQLAERNKPCVLAEKDAVLAENDAVLAEIDRLIDKLSGIKHDAENVCVSISKILNKIFQMLKCGMVVANKIFESKLYFRLFILISMIGYFSNPTCAAVINTTGAVIFNIMDLILRNASPENYAKLQAIFTSINNVVQFVGAAFGLISEKGMAMIACLKIMIELMEGATVDSIKLAMESFQTVVETLKISTEDLKKILDAVKALGLNGDQMAQLLLSIMNILTDMQAASVPAGDVTTTILQRLTGSLSGVAITAGSQAAITTIATTIATAMSNVPRIGNGNGGGKRNKKTRKNKKKTENKRRKQQRKSKRR